MGESSNSRATGRLYRSPLPRCAKIAWVPIGHGARRYRQQGSCERRTVSRIVSGFLGLGSMSSTHGISQTALPPAQFHREQPRTRRHERRLPLRPTCTTSAPMSMPKWRCNRARLPRRSCRVSRPRPPSWQMLIYPLSNSPSRDLSCSQTSVAAEIRVNLLWEKGGPPCLCKV
jgi:hypothetical protein